MELKSGKNGLRVAKMVGNGSYIGLKSQEQVKKRKSILNGRSWLKMAERRRNDGEIRY